MGTEEQQEKGKGEDMRTTCTRIKVCVVEYKRTVASAFLCVCGTARSVPVSLSICLV